MLWCDCCISYVETILHGTHLPRWQWLSGISKLFYQTFSGKFQTLFQMIFFSEILEKWPKIDLNLARKLENLKKIRENSKKLENSKIKELKNKFAFEPGPYLVRKDKIILSQVACNYYKNIKIDAAKVKMRKNGKCERLTHFTLSLCQLWYCMIKISSHFNPPNFSQIYAKFRSKMKILTFSWPKWSKGVGRIRNQSQNKFLE